MILRKPIVLMIHPDIILPPKHEVASIIIVKPCRLLTPASLPVILSIHAGAQEKTTHKPISIAPKIAGPFIRSFLLEGAKSLLLIMLLSGEVCLLFFQFPDADKVNTPTIAVITGTYPC